MLRLLFVVIFVLIVAGSALAQTTPPTINIPTNDIFTQMNNWITIIAPIFAIGIGISLAFAVLAFIGRVIVGAFRGTGGGSR